MENEAEVVLAGTIRDTLLWAMRQATVPAIADVESEGACVTFRDGWSKRLFMFTVREIK